MITRMIKTKAPRKRKEQPYDQWTINGFHRTQSQHTGRLVDYKTATPGDIELFTIPTPSPFKYQPLGV